MPDQRSVLKEYRALEQKRLAQGLTPAEDRRHAELKALVGPETSGGARGGFDVNAAAAKLRESLLPAGLRNRPPPTPEVLEPEPPEPPAPEPAPAEEALAAAWADQPFQPLDTPQAPADGFFDPSSLGTEQTQPQWDPNAAWDPNTQQPYDPNAAAGWDPAAAAAAGYDPNQPWDPNAQPAYDPGATAGYDPNAPWDPNAAAAAGYDPNQPWDSSAQPAYDPNAAWDPSTQQAYDPNAAPGWDPNAATAPAEGAWDPASLGAEGAAPPAPEYGALEGEHVFSPVSDAAGSQGDWSAAAPASGPHDGPVFPGGQGAELEDPYALVPGTEPGAPETTAEGGFPEGWDPGGASPMVGPSDHAAGPPAALELGEYEADGAQLPFDAAAASAIDPGQLPEGFEAVPGEYEDNAGFGVTGYEAPTAQHLGDDAANESVPSWQPDSALDQGFELASGGSFDAAADAASPDWAGAAPAAGRPWAGHEPVAPPSSSTELDRSAPDLSGGEAADDFFAISAPPLALGGPSSVPAAAPQPIPPPAPFVAVAPPGPAPKGPPPGLRSPASAPSPVARPQPAPAPVAFAPRPPGPMPATDEIPELDAEEILEPADGEVVEEIVDTGDAGAGAPPDLDFPSTIAEPFPPSPPPAAYAAADRRADPDRGSEPEPAEPPPPAPAAPRAPLPALPTEDVSFEDPPEPSSSAVPGVHRVVVHTLEGLVKRGVLTDADLAAPVLGLAPTQGAEPEVLGADKVKAIFFMLAPGEAAPAPEGKRVRVTFRDGRQVAGFSPDYKEGGIGFFMVPADSRTNTGRIWIYRAAVKSVSVS